MIRVLLLVLLLSGCAGQSPYYSVGAGYKFDEPTIRFWDDYGNPRTSHPVSARFELGIDAESFKYGVSHHSQWSDGWPFNNRDEIHKTEVFVDYVYKFKPLR